MKRGHFNQTTEPITFRTWILDRETVGEDDFLWLKAFNIPIRIDRPSHEFTTPIGGSHTVYGKPTFTLDTTTNKQRDMLVLKYGNDVVLLLEETLLPNSISVCTLDRINW